MGLLFFFTGRWQLDQLIAVKDKCMGHMDHAATGRWQLERMIRVMAACCKLSFLVVLYLASLLLNPRFAGSNPAKDDKNPKYAFLWRLSKAISPLS
jgi:hypothetical protein